MLLQTFAGTETFPGATCKVMCWYIGGPNSEEVSMHIAARDPKANLRSLHTSSFDASEYNKNHGFWVEQRWDILPGAFVKVSVRRREGHGFAYQTAQVMLRMREDAALRQIRIRLTEHPDSSRSAGYIDGKFDVIPWDDFNAWRLIIPSNFEETFNPENWGDIMRITVQEREGTPYAVPKIEKLSTHSGKTILVRSKPSRLIRMKPI